MLCFLNEDKYSVLCVHVFNMFQFFFVCSDFCVNQCCIYVNLSIYCTVLRIFMDRTQYWAVIVIIIIILVLLPVVLVYSLTWPLYNFSELSRPRIHIYNVIFHSSSDVVLAFVWKWICLTGLLGSMGYICVSMDSGLLDLTVFCVILCNLSYCLLNT